MNPSAEAWKSRLPGVPAPLIEEHVRRLDARYFRRFRFEEIAAHLRDIAALSPERPAVVRADAARRGLCRCTVVAFDHPGEFSLITGILASLGFDIQSGEVFTYAPSDAASDGNRARDPAARRRIVDEFTGTVEPESADADWGNELATRLVAVLLPLERGEPDAASGARRRVSEMAAGKLARMHPDVRSVLLPVQIAVEDLAACTRMRVVAQDTPFFLFAFSSALSLQRVSIEHVVMRTAESRIEDEFEFIDARGGPVRDPARLDDIKLSVLLTKQFTYFLDRAPDPLAALLRFENLIGEIVRLPQRDRWTALLSDGSVLPGLALLLGASTFLWEDFIRLQYEALLPLMAPGGGSFAAPVETLAERLDDCLRGTRDRDLFRQRLNAFKDREIFLIDLDHLLDPAVDLREFGRKLTALAEAVVDRAASRAFRDLAARFGEPRTVADLPVRHAILGLGKTGGVALGYASDIELLFVYGDRGSSAGGPEGSLDNREFFEMMVRETVASIRARREGIFHVDLRLRPYGDAGPLAVPLGGFLDYYGPGGPARSYERLSLVRLRALGGDPVLAARVERLRDELVYGGRSVDLADLAALRERQMREKTDGRWNAKFSPGALVDIEYTVQILQVIHGGRHAGLRTPRIHEALDALATAGVLETAEAADLADAYDFFRRLINGLRMLRGSAQDLFLPPEDSDEFLHLARRMGPGPSADPGAARRLHLDFQTRTAQVRSFVERRLGRDSLPGAGTGNVADLVLSPSVPEGLRREILAAKGFRDPERAFVNLHGIAEAAEGVEPLAFARAAVLACDLLSVKPDPDMALNNWERFVRSLPDPGGHIGRVSAQPMALEILLTLFSSSQFLADALIRDPALADWVSAPENLHVACSADAVETELDAASGEAGGRAEWLDRLRFVRRREILRIAARDLVLAVPTRRIMGEISELADGILRSALRRAWGGTGPAGFCLLAFGKLGGRELNYSSDIDIVGVFDPHAVPDAATAVPMDAASAATAAMERLRADLAEQTPAGSVYRVDLRLRPYGSAGPLVHSLPALSGYYRRAASFWELQALLKARPVAGDIGLGMRFLEAARDVLFPSRGRIAAAEAPGGARRKAAGSGPRASLDVKTDPGGIRDVEFLVQGLQLRHGAGRPELATGNTLDALEALGRAGLLPADVVERTADDYLFLRKLEHFLQIHGDRQVHSLPRDPGEVRALARRMMPAHPQGVPAESATLLAELERRMARVRAIRALLDSPPPSP